MKLRQVTSVYDLWGLVRSS